MRNLIQQEIFSYVIDNFKLYNFKSKAKQFYFRYIKVPVVKNFVTHKQFSIAKSLKTWNVKYSNLNWKENN